MFLPMLRGYGYGWLPLSAGASVMVGLVVPYIIAVRLGHVYPILPLVSETGALEPESCYFAQLMNIASVLVAATVYLRFKQISNKAKDVPKNVLKWNTISAPVGYLAAFGLSLVANFPLYLPSVQTVQNFIHIAGALVCFGLGVYYGALQSRISYALSTDFWSRAMAFLRCTLTASTAVFFISTTVFVNLSDAEFNGTFAERLNWGPEDGGYVLHLYSSISEYLMCFTYTLLIVTFYKELETIKPVKNGGGGANHV